MFYVLLVREVIEAVIVTIGLWLAIVLAAYWCIRYVVGLTKGENW